MTELVLKTRMDLSQLPAKGSERESQHEEEHFVQGEYLKSAVYGGLDGVINILIIILGGIGAGATPYTTMTIALGALFGDGVGMGLGDYLSSKSEMQYIRAEQKREELEVDTRLEDEKDEIRAIYLDQGYTQQQVK